MGKQELRTTKTQVRNHNSEGEQVHHTLTLDDSLLPSPEELQKYKEIDSDIVKLLIDATRKEQDHRHFSEKQEYNIVNRDIKARHTVNIFGMCLAFLIICAISIDSLQNRFSKP